MSENQFLRRFRRAFDTSPLQYLLDLRMKHACALLEESDLSIAQIASSTGFYDSNYFLKLYKRKFGLPAGRARRETAKKKASALFGRMPVEPSADPYFSALPET